MNEAITNTPISDAYQMRISELEQSTNITDVSLLVLGSYVNVPRSDRSSGCTGFVKTIGRVNVTIETSYGGMGGSDISLLELTIKKADITAFYNPVITIPEMFDTPVMNAGQFTKQEMKQIKAWVKAGLLVEFKDNFAMTTTIKTYYVKSNP